MANGITAPCAREERDVDAVAEAATRRTARVIATAASEQQQRRALAGEAPVDREGSVVEPGLVGEREGPVLKIGARRAPDLRWSPPTGCGELRRSAARLGFARCRRTRSPRPELRRLLAAGRSLVPQLDIEAVLDELLEIARELTGAQYAALGVLDEHRRHLERFVTRGLGEDARRMIGDPPHGRGILGVLIEDPRPLRLERVGDDPRSTASRQATRRWTASSACR